VATVAFAAPPTFGTVDLAVRTEGATGLEAATIAFIFVTVELMATDGTAVAAAALVSDPVDAKAAFGRFRTVPAILSARGI
jgi:hypothetical protein